MKKPETDERPTNPAPQEARPLALAEPETFSYTDDEGATITVTIWPTPEGTA